MDTTFESHVFVRAAGALGRTWPDLRDLGSTWATWEVLDDFWLAQSPKVASCWAVHDLKA